MKNTALFTALLALAPPAFAQHHAHQHDAATTSATAADADASTDTDDTAGMNHAAMDHAAMDHTGMDHMQMEGAAADHAQMDHAAMDHGTMDHASAAAPAAYTPVPTPTAADRAAAFPDLASHAMHAPSLQRYVLLDRLEGWNRDAGNGQAWEASAWFGGDIDRLWLRSEGERTHGRTSSADVEALYGHAISPWWDVLAGVRQELGHDHRSWAALGLQGQAPYKFEVAATLYLGAGGASALRLESEYDVLLSNRLILQPRIEGTLLLSDDDHRQLDAGAESVEAGLRLRYEITRRIAPYIGWSHQRRFGAAARRAGSDDEPARDSHIVAGLRIWF